LIDKHEPSLVAQMANPLEMTILDIIKGVLPDGTTLDSTGWDAVCEWPPDLFAAVAAITERSGLYSEQTFMAYWAPDFVLTEEWITKTREFGREWARLGTPPEPVQSLWKELIRKHRKARIDDPSDAALAWKRIVFHLLTIADEACVGIGFAPPRSAEPNTVASSPTSTERENTIQYIVYKDYIAWDEKRQRLGSTAMGGDVLPYLPQSLCIRVPPAVLCVQPKTSTPAVGCTLRSLTHHLALLPSIANVSTHWHIANKPYEDSDAFNVLVVPFPFSIPGKSFNSGAGSFPGASNERVFKLNPDIWMRGTAPHEFVEFLCGLIEVAKLELEPVHAIVLPEAALRLEFANEVARLLAKGSGLDLLLTGVVAGANGDARNCAAIYRFFDGKLVHSSFQSKHHRWCLNADQICRYHLGHVLDPHHKWWEQIDVSYRHCYVTLFRPRATLSVLVCEDLARYDPVLTVMNAIGPNLVVALLMDGPQLEQRWPARYATVLADDPGSSVLTVTSLGMVARSKMPGEPLNGEIALWKEPEGKAWVLKLPKGDHALLLTLTSRLVEQFTLDGRGDGKSTVHFGLSAAHGIRHLDPPKWLG
jgi:hypothetical protein